QLVYPVFSVLLDFPNRFAWPQQICAGHDDSLSWGQTVENQYLAAGQQTGPDWNRLCHRSPRLLLGCVDEIMVASRIAHQSVDRDLRQEMAAFGLCGLNGGNHP